MDIKYVDFLNKFDGLKKDIEVGKPIEIGERTIYPIVEVSELKGSSYEFMNIVPIALVVVEGENKYMFALNEKEVSRDLMEFI
ncbi:MAG: hypothetical protein ACXVHM_08620 [Methanobacterium sp.]|jgi:uncharacterized spore protein YtfJ